MTKTPAPHILVIPFPSQGHVIPLMKLSVCLADRFGFRITFLNLRSTQVDDDDDDDHDSTAAAAKLIRMVDVLDHGVECNGNKSTEAVMRLMPGRVEDLIDRMMIASESDAITCLLADQTIPWALEIARKRGIRRVGFCPAAASVVALQFSIPKLIRDGIIDEEGNPMKEDQTVKLSEEMPALKPAEFAWNCFEDENTRTHMFGMVVRSTESMKSAEWLLCNSAQDIEPGSFGSTPSLLPIGPLLGSTASTVGSFWDEDQTCLKWLDLHPPNSVIYVAFGSIALFDPGQLEELAFGLELSNRPFCWVVRSDHMTPEMKPVLDRVLGRGAEKKQGKVVSWAPQEKVLAHPSVGCFVSHCGWNSTLEGLANGVPFLCWPYFADQFMNASYVCDVWRVGMRLERDGGSGMVSREEVRKKVGQLVGSVEVKERSLEMMEMVRDSVGEGGRSNQNLVKFVEWVRGS